MVVRQARGAVAAALSVAERPVSIIVPVLNEADGILAFLRHLQVFRSRGHEVIVVDGGSEDGTAELAGALADCVHTAPRGRASQMNAGTSLARNDIFLFLHADTRLPVDALQAVCRGLADGHCQWGRFSIRLDGTHWLFRLVETGINWRSRLTCVATGDQAMFVTRQCFEAVAGFDEIPLMEDVALSKKLRRRFRPLCLAQVVVSSGRRWESRGIIATIVLMWRLRLAYFLGADPARLARLYSSPGAGSHQDST